MKENNKLILKNLAIMYINNADFFLYCSFNNVKESLKQLEFPQNQLKFCRKWHKRTQNIFLIFDKSSK
jgi:hypothetical protein